MLAYCDRSWIATEQWPQWAGRRIEKAEQQRGGRGRSETTEAETGGGARSGGDRRKDEWVCLRFQERKTDLGWWRSEPNQSSTDEAGADRQCRMHLIDRFFFYFSISVDRLDHRFLWVLQFASEPGLYYRSDRS